MFLNQDDKLWQYVDEIALGTGVTVYDFEKRGAGQLLISIAKVGSKIIGGNKDIGAGVGSDECSKLIRELMVNFQVTAEEFGLANEPSIEVSTPGVNRILRLPAHFIGAVGERVKVVILTDDVSQCLLGNIVNSDGVTVVVHDEQTKKDVKFEVDSVKNARIDYKF